MKLIVGLGNIGKDYEQTRHNAGFMVIDELLNDLQLNTKEKFNGEFVKTNINGEDVILAKPHTFMNLSGDFVKKVIDFYKIDIQDILVIYDDKDMDIGKIKLRDTGSSGGQNGIKHIMQVLGTEKVKRLKVGIGPAMGPTSNYVLARFNKEQQEILKTILKRAMEASKAFVSKDFLAVCNQFNGK